MVAKFTQEQFETKVREKIGNRLDISKFVYNGQASRGVVCCPKHGEYEVRASSLLNGKGCAKCYFESKVGKFKFGLDEFLEKARKTHGNAYCYDKVIYCGVKQKITITCKEHGDFEQQAFAHINGRKCPACGAKDKGKKNRNTQVEFIAAVKERYGDKFDLSKTEYVGLKKNVVVTCREHGEFTTSAGSFLNSKIGCPKCALESQGLKRRIEKDEYVKQLVETHGDRFEYGEILREKGGPFIQVKCKDHGWFKASINNLRHGAGCKKCYHNSRVGIYKVATDEFVAKAIAVHGDKYDYSRVEYKGANKKVKIVCNEHGEFLQNARSHIAGQGCRKCWNAMAGVKSRLSQSEFLERAEQKHGKKYDLSKAEYVSSQKSVKIVCPEHGEFTTSAGNFMGGLSGCQRCARKMLDCWHASQEMNTLKEQDNTTVTNLNMVKLPTRVALRT